MQPPEVLVADVHSVMAVVSEDAENDNAQQLKKKKKTTSKKTMSKENHISNQQGYIGIKVKLTQHCVPKCNHGRAESL